MRIGVNALYLIPGAVGGTEIYLRCVLAALARIDSTNEYVVFANRETGPDLVPAAPNFHFARQPVPARIRPARILWEQTILPIAVTRASLDVLYNPGFTAPILCGIPQVTVFHDLQHLRHPEYFRWFDLPFWRILLHASAHLSQRLIAVSNATASDLVRFYRLPQDRIDVIPSGVDERFFDLTRDPKPYLLAVSTLHPHKNLDGLLAAFAAFRRTHSGFRLIVAGMRGFHADALERCRAQHGLGDTVQFTGWIPRKDLYALYAAAWAFVYPSKFEGFGMPVLEAMAAGIPTACSDIEPLRSIAGSAALLMNPDDMAGALARLCDDESLRATLAAAGPARAREFSWEETARGTLRCLEAAL